MAKRLTKLNWIDHGLAVLASEGHEALKADLMVKSLGVSRGSFYWHFEDIEAFEEALIVEWRRQSIEALFPVVSVLENDNTKLHDVLNVLLPSKPRLDAAMHRWAWNMQKVLVVVGEVDRLRQRYIEHALLRVGISVQAASQRASMLMAAITGLMLDAEPTNAINSQRLEPIASLFSAPS